MEDRPGMTTAEKIRNRQPISREEFRELVKKTDWQDYAQRVVARIFPIALAHEEMRARSLAGSCHVYW